MAVPDTVLCIDCGGQAHRLTHDPPDDDPWRPGDVVAYRCPDCLDRWDLVLEAEDLEDGSPGPTATW